MSVKHNAHIVAARLGARGPAVQAAVEQELDVQAQLVARRMKQEASKFLGTLSGSVHVEMTAPTERLVAPGTDYAEAVHDGIKPGGKGLPRYFDPEARDIQRWLESRAPSSFVGPSGLFGQRRPSKGSSRYTARELELRNRYQGLAWHIRHFGTRADPFVNRTHEAMAASVVAGLKAAVARALNPDGAGWRAT